MNREIKFRGKRGSDNSWIYGSLVASDEIIPVIYFPAGNGEVKQMEWFYVKPETIGQFTGLTDCKGKEIFEGDIIESGGFRHIIEYDAKQARYSAMNAMHISHPIYGGSSISQLWIDECEKVVIGNIYDNPEMIKR